MRFGITLLGGAVALALGAGATGQFLAGPVAAEVIDVVDGDTVVVRAHIWLGQEVETRIRLAGIDTPERRGACARERSLAAVAEAYVRATLMGHRVMLSDIRYDKYGGRVVARIKTAEGVDVSDELVRRQIARPYDGKTKASWCA
jgi:endonuclease YncB( thermonuclease family)